MGGLGVFDIIGGFIIGIITAGSIALLRKATDNAFVLVLPIALGPSLIVPIWLSILLKIPYVYLVLSLLLGQMISAYTLGVFIVRSHWIKALIK